LRPAVPGLRRSRWALRYTGHSKEENVFGGQEWLVVVLVVVVLFGARRLPELARSLGASAKEFKKGIAEGAEGSAEDTDHSNS